MRRLLIVALAVVAAMCAVAFREIESTIVGLVGGLLIASAWLLEVREDYRTKKPLNLNFTSLSLCGTLLLLIYSISERDLVFIFLNTLIFILIIVELLISRKRHVS